MNTAYEELTVPELKDLAESRGIPVPYDARKAEIIAALEASDLLLTPPEETSPPEDTREKGAEGKNIYEFQMSSTETALCSPDDFWKLKLTS